MTKYRVHLTGRFGRLIEMSNFMSDSDVEASLAIMDDLTTTQTAEIWHGTRLVSRIAKTGVAWQAQ